MSDDAAHSIFTAYRPNRRTLLQAGSLALLLAGKHQIAFGASIMAVRVWPAEDYSRVTLESDVPLVAKQTLITSPPRLAVDIEGLQLNNALKELVAKVRPDDPNIAAIRVGQNSPNVVRLVIDLKQEAVPQVFTLKPVAAYQHRLVFDLYPSKAIDPLEALIQERLRDAGSSSNLPPALSPPAEHVASHDPWGLIAKHSGQAPRPVHRRHPHPLRAIKKSPLPRRQPRLPPKRPKPQSQPAQRLRRAKLTASSSWHSTPATAVKTLAPSAPVALTKKMWCSRLPNCCATASMAAPSTAAPCGPT